MKIRPPADPSAVVIPFGRHKGATVAELLEKDRPYVDWVLGQGWLAERFAEVHAALLTRGAGTDDTPEHNALQARFLDHPFRQAVLRLTSKARVINKLNMHLIERREYLMDRIKKGNPYGYYDFSEEEAKEKLENMKNDTFVCYTSVEFEKSGVDVKIHWCWSYNGSSISFNDRNPFYGFVNVEIKPGMGDDYPAVMREMQRLGSTVLVLDQYTGRGVSEPQVREMFRASGYEVAFVQEIEEDIRLARDQRSEAGRELITPV